MTHALNKLLENYCTLQISRRLMPDDLEIADAANRAWWALHDEWRPSMFGSDAAFSTWVRQQLNEKEANT